MRQKYYIFLIIFGLFIILLGSTYYFYLRLGRLQETADISFEEQEGKVIPIDAASPIRKSTLPDSKGIAYELEGSFIEKLEHKNDFVSGKFIIKDDPLNREMNLVAGSLAGDALFGIYDETFKGGASWKMVSTEVIAELIAPNEPVKLLIVLYPSTENVDGYVKDRIELLDILTLEFGNKIFSAAIPGDMVTIIERVGVIR